MENEAQKNIQKNPALISGSQVEKITRAKILDFLKAQSSILSFLERYNLYIRIKQYWTMTKRKKDNGYSLFPGGLTPKGAYAKQDTGDARNTNPSKNMKRKYGGLF
jgi:hypothetical protein